MFFSNTKQPPTSWNKGKLTGQKQALKLKEVWAIRIRLQLTINTRELALFNMAIDSKLRGCDLVSLKIADVIRGGTVAKRATTVQRKTQRPVQFQITKQTRDAVANYLCDRPVENQDYLFKSRMRWSPHLSTRQYARIVKSWVDSIGLDPSSYGTHSMRRTKVSLIYKQTKNLRAVQLLLGHTKLESTVRYLGVEVDDALEISEAIEV